MELDVSIKKAFDGEAILFLGAGFSFGGINKEGNKILTGAGLSRKLCEVMNIQESDNLTITASRFIDDDNCKLGINKLIEILKNELVCEKTLDIQKIIVALPWMRIYTTNYDNIIEKATDDIGKKRASITATSSRYNPNEYLDEAIIHINGKVEDLDENIFHEEFKITDDNYLRDGFLESKWRGLFVSDLEKAKVIIFIGYSLDYDQDIKKIISRLNIKEKCIFIDIPDLKDEAEYKLSKYGKLYKIGTSGFAEMVKTIKVTYNPRKKLKMLQGFEQVYNKDYYTNESYTSKDVIELILKGAINRKYLNKPNYCIKRKESIELAINLLKYKKVLILHSKFGNGKTIFTEILGSVLCEDKNVYFVKNLDTMYEDLQAIVNNKDKENIIIIDDYGYYMKLLREINKDFPENIKLVLTCRTAININLYYDMLNKYNYVEDDIEILDIDILKNTEIYEAVKMLDYNRLWGIHDRKNRSNKKSLILKKYKSNTSNLFYLLLDSKKIADSIRDILEESFKKEGLKNFIFAQVINSICNLKLTFYDICTFLNISENLLEKYKIDSNVCEIIDFKNNKMCFTSSVFAKYILKQNNYSEEVINILKKIYQESERIEFNNKYVEQRKTLISRSNIKFIFSKADEITTNEESKIFEYYDYIKNTRTASENPFFWLQFGITALNLKEYDLAILYFNNAYSNITYLDKFDSYQLDTHRARLLLNYQLDTNRNSKDDAIKSFKEANDLLLNNSNSGKNLIYVLKQTGIYNKYYNTYKTYFDDVEKDEFIKTAYIMAIRYEEYFNIPDIKVLPYEIINNYKEYRKLFIDSAYKIHINKLDEIFNLKVTTKNQKVKRL